MFQNHPNKICINLHDPLTRLQNKYQMVVANEIDNNKTGIRTVLQM
jgi:hypothetical protein